MVREQLKTEYKHDIAPSKVKTEEILDVAECVLKPGREYHDVKEFRTDVFKDLHTVSEVILANDNDYDLSANATLLNNHGRLTLDVTRSEASGYTMLGIFAVYFSDVLTAELNKGFRYVPQFEVADNEKSGQNPRTDTCIVLLMKP